VRVAVIRLAQGRNFSNGEAVALIGIEALEHDLGAVATECFQLRATFFAVTVKVVSQATYATAGNKLRDGRLASGVASEVVGLRLDVEEETTRRFRVVLVRVDLLANDVREHFLARVDCRDQRILLVLAVL